MKHITSPTRYMVILGRTYADGTDADYKAVNALQAQYKITPLSAWGKPFTYQAPPVDPNPGFSMTDKPQDVILAMGTEGYFDLMARLMGERRAAGRGRCADAREAWRRSASSPASRSSWTSSMPPSRRR